MLLPPFILSVLWFLFLSIIQRMPSGRFDLAFVSE